MPLDSSANLLFSIGADSSDAEGNIQRFRGLLGKDLAGIGAEFDAWSTKILGEITTVQGAMIAGGALLGAGLVAVAGFAVEAAHKYSSYVDEIAKGSRTTGISVENMSRLKYAADATHTSYESLVSGLTRLTVGVVKATQDWETHGAAFRALNITQEQVKAGEKDLMGLVMIMSDRFHELGSRVLATAEARELFLRGGARLVQMLSQGSAGLREMGLEAEKLGLVIGTKDVEANEGYKASIHLMKAELQGFVMTVGKDVLPVLTAVTADVLGLALGIRDSFKNTTWVDYVTLGLSKIVKAGAYGRQEADALKLKIEELAKSLSKFGNETGNDLVAPVKAAKEEWTGLTDLLEKVKERTEDLTSIDQKQAQELEKIGIAVEKATKKYEELLKSGKLSPEDAKAQAAALAQWNDAVGALIAHYDKLVIAKNQAAGEKLDDETAAQAEQTYAVKSAAWDREINKQAEVYQREGSLEGENQEKLLVKWLAGHAKLEREKAAAHEAATADLEKRIAAQGEKTAAGEAAAWNAEMDAQRREYAKKATYEGEYDAQIERERTAGLERIARTQQAAFDTEMAGLGQQLEKIRRSHQTAEQRIQEQYQVDVEKFTAAEEKKALAAATSDAQRTAISARYSAIRAGLLVKEGQDLQALHNSQGWKGVFGKDFAQAIKGNEDLSDEWADSTNRARMMVKVSLESLKEQGQQAFAQLSQGMGASIMHAIIYKESVGAAMKAVLASTMATVAQESIVYAIRSTAMGFMALAAHDYPGADAAFTAAAIWGSVGAAAAVAGRGVAPSQAGAAGASGAGSGSAAGAGAGASGGAAGGAAAGGPHVTVNVWGHIWGVSGVQEVASALNDAVLNRDVILTASNTKTGVQVTR